MTHALIIEDNMIVGHAIEQQLAQAGFRSFDHAWTENQAIGHAERHMPDLVVIGDGIEEGSAMAAARAIGRRGAVPVLLATTDPFRTSDHLPPDLAIHGPCRIDEIERTIEALAVGTDRESLALS